MTTTTSPPATATLPAVLQAPNQPLRWLKVLDLGYASSEPHEEDAAAILSPCCFHCGSSSPAAAAEVKNDDSSNNNNKNNKPLLQCSQCQVASYCSKEHQIADWKQGGHKAACHTYARLRHIHKDDPSTVRDELWGRVRLYLGPYAVYKHQQLGRGFLFVQSNQTLACLSLALPKDEYGRSTGMRSLLVHYLTLGEYDQEVCRDDFEMAMVRSELHEAVNTTTACCSNQSDEVVVLMRFRCGHVALGVASLGDYALCQQLGQSYFGGDNNQDSAGALQLNLDDL